MHSKIFERLHLFSWRYIYHIVDISIGIELVKKINYSSQFALLTYVYDPIDKNVLSDCHELSLYLSYLCALKNGSAQVYPPLIGITKSDFGPVV